MVVRREIIVGVVVNISSLVCALCMGWTSSMVPVLTHESPLINPLDKPLTVDQGAWITSVLSLGGMASPFLGGFLADKIGRKKTLLGNAVIFLASFLIMAFGPTYETLLVARLLQGFAIGVSWSVQAMYIGEIASDDLRGSLGSFMNLFIGMGFVIMNSVGPYLPYQSVQFVLAAIPLVFMSFFVLMPESPYFYVARGQTKDALKALSYLRRQPEAAVQPELERIEKIIESSKPVDGSSKLKAFLSPGSRKALLICGFLVACQQLSGINGVLSYAATIFGDAGIAIEANLAVIILSVVMVLASFVSPVLADRSGRRPLLFSSTTLATLFLVLFAVYKYGVEENVQEIAALNWLPIVAIMGYLVAFSVGLGPLPWTMTSELFPANVKSIAAPTMTCISWASTFLVTKFLPPMSLALGSYSVFGIFAGFGALGFLFTLFVVFETKGLSLMEIQDKLNKRK